MVTMPEQFGMAISDRKCIQVHSVTLLAVFPKSY